MPSLTTTFLALLAAITLVTSHHLPTHPHRPAQPTWRHTVKPPYPSYPHPPPSFPAPKPKLGADVVCFNGAAKCGAEDAVRSARRSIISSWPHHAEIRPTYRNRYGLKKHKPTRYGAPASLTRRAQTGTWTNAVLREYAKLQREEGGKKAFIGGLSGGGCGIICPLSWFKDKDWPRMQVGNKVVKREVERLIGLL